MASTIKTVTKDDIITLPNLRLRQRSSKVSFVTPEIKQLVHDMQAATIDWENSRQHEVGVALAAIQIDQPYRVVVIRNNFDDKTDHSFTVFINPIITKYEGHLQSDYEGCLSVKNIYGMVPRYSKVRVKAMGIDGREFRVTAENFMARIFQHEIDHTNGIVFVDHIRDDPSAFYKLAIKGDLEPLEYNVVIKDNTDLWEE